MWERNIDRLPPTHTPSRDQNCYLGMCPDWELNPSPFGVRDDTPTNWVTWPGQDGTFHEEWNLTHEVPRDWGQSKCFQVSWVVTSLSQLPPEVACWHHLNGFRTSEVCAYTRARGGISRHSRVLKSKIQPSKFEDIIGFIKRFVNQAGFSSRKQKCAPRGVQNRKFLQEGWGKGAINKRK